MVMRLLRSSIAISCRRLAACVVRHTERGEEESLRDQRSSQSMAMVQSMVVERKRSERGELLIVKEVRSPRRVEENSEIRGGVRG